MIQINGGHTTVILCKAHVGPKARVLEVGSLLLCPSPSVCLLPQERESLENGNYQVILLLQQLATLNLTNFLLFPFFWLT